MTAMVMLIGRIDEKGGLYSCNIKAPLVGGYAVDEVSRLLNVFEIAICTQMKQVGNIDSAVFDKYLEYDLVGVYRNRNSKLADVKSLTAGCLMLRHQGFLQIRGYREEYHERLDLDILLESLGMFRVDSYDNNCIEYLVYKKEYKVVPYWLQREGGRIFEL